MDWAISSESVARYLYIRYFLTLFDKHFESVLDYDRYWPALGINQGSPAVYFFMDKSWLTWLWGVFFHWWIGCWVFQWATESHNHMLPGLGHIDIYWVTFWLQSVWVLILFNTYRFCGDSILGFRIDSQDIKYGTQWTIVAVKWWVPIMCNFSVPGDSWPVPLTLYQGMLVKGHASRSFFKYFELGIRGQLWLSILYMGMQWLLIGYPLRV